MNRDIEQEIRELQMLQGKITKSLQAAPAGKLLCRMSQGKYPEYYKVNSKNGGRKYLRKDEREYARALSQKEYDMKMLVGVEELLKSMRQIQSIDEDKVLKEVYKNMPEAKRRLISPYILEDAEYIKQWMDQRPAACNPIAVDTEIFTELDEEVRSKSEKIIADKFYIHKIPYVYESTLILPDGRKLYPDFTVLNVRTRKTYYYEHFGMMDNPEYCKKAIEKIELYSANGIMLGDQLLVTFESSLKPINVKTLEEMIAKYLI